MKTGASGSSPAPPRLAFSKAEVAAMLGISVDFVEDHLIPGMKVIRVGRKLLIPRVEVERWLIENAARSLGER